MLCGNYLEDPGEEKDAIYENDWIRERKAQSITGRERDPEKNIPNFSG